MAGFFDYLRMVLGWPSRPPGEPPSPYANWVRVTVPGTDNSLVTVPGGLEE
jgi:hypothetical protein